MPLSEHEQRLLEQLEQQLHEDQRFASAMKSGGGYSTRNIVIGALIVAVGLVALILGISSKLIIVGVLGFAAMCVGVYVALSRTGKTDAGTPGGGGRPDRRPGKSSFMADLEAKWDQRRRDQDM
ncbi:DUF3040 domain-containing protein [Zhihengliuella sp.]|uniref:DUF3040 domain-containing protein n=1 Tax=Zhihengliuella sp. TaxID=1954483 RepID=UPI002811DB3D|nr:DUF3040 domain-containing protein [Zhihengliuella sp.]